MNEPSAFIRALEENARRDMAQIGALQARIVELEAKLAALRASEPVAYEYATLSGERLLTHQPPDRVSDKYQGVRALYAAAPPADAKPAGPDAYEQAAQACELERISETDGVSNEDVAYNLAITHCVRAIRALASRPAGLVGFYEREFYPLSNFSAFRLMWKGIDFDQSEIAYHWEKFPYHPELQKSLLACRSAHEAFKLAEQYATARRPDWNAVKVGIMREILRAKVQQHEYVRRKLIQTGNRELVEDSWRDNFWGWGPNKDGQNMLGKLWMEIRAELPAAPGARGAAQMTELIPALPLNKD